MKIIKKHLDKLKNKPKLIRERTTGTGLTLYHYQTKKSILITTKKL